MDGENGFKVYLAFSTGFFWDFFSFMGERCSVEFGGKASVIFCPKILSALPWSFGDSFNTSCQANCCPKTESFSRSSLPGVFWHQISTSLSLSVLKIKFFFPISSDEKGTTSGFRVLANHFPSFFFLHLPLSCYSFGLLYWPLYPLLCPPGHRV